jgi:hypothetical protein
MMSLAAIAEGGRSGRHRPHRRGMSTGLRRLATVLLVLLLAACGDSFDDDIKAVKASPGPGGTAEQFVNQLAGARGQVTWSGSKPQRYKDNPNIVEVVAKIEKSTRAGAKRQVDLAWINNRQTRQVALERVAIDGQPQSFAAGALGILLMQLD